MIYLNMDNMYMEACMLINIIMCMEVCMLINIYFYLDAVIAADYP